MVSWLKFEMLHFRGDTVFTQWNVAKACKKYDTEDKVHLRTSWWFQTILPRLGGNDDDPASLIPYRPYGYLT